MRDPRAAFQMKGDQRETSLVLKAKKIIPHIVRQTGHFCPVIQHNRGDEVPRKGEGPRWIFTSFDTSQADMEIDKVVFQEVNYLQDIMEHNRGVRKFIQPRSNDVQGSQ